MKKGKVRPIFIYLVFIAIILGAIGSLIIISEKGGFVGQIVETKEKYSYEEVLKHNSEEGCWIIVDGRVYDITLFMRVYPKDLKDKCGKIIEASFFSKRDKKILEAYQIGLLD